MDGVVSCAVAEDQVDSTALFSHAQTSWVLEAVTDRTDGGVQGGEVLRRAWTGS